jgi:hypothetical protein
MTAPPPELRVVHGRGGKRYGPALELVALGTGVTLSMALLARLPSWYHALGTFQALVVVAFAFYGLVLFNLRRYAELPRVGIVVFAVALAARVALLPVPPSLSGDAYRYVWEGRAVLHGFDPYQLPPADPRLASLRDPTIYPGINHPELSTIYPPIAMAGFALVARVSDTVEAMKLWVVLHDLLLVAALIVWMPKRGVSPAAAIAYAWNPLVITEYAGSGHNDPTALLWLVLALALADRRPVVSALALATGVGVKLAPILALPGLLLRWTWPGRIAGVLAVGVVVGVTAALAHGPASGFAAYWSSWRNNELVFQALERATGRFEIARTLAIAAVAAALAFAVWRRRSPERCAQLGARVATLVTPVLHPWYLGWTVVFEPFTRSVPWLVGSACVLMSYGLGHTPPEGRNFHLPLEWRLVEYGVPLAAGLVASMTARTGRRRRT